MKKKIRITFLFLIVLCFSHIGRVEGSIPAGTKEDVTVKGTVTSMEDNAPIPGVNVMIQGTTRGTVTDLDGNYSIEVPEDGTLVFSFIGYLTEEIPVGGRSTINIAMAMDIETLDEVVVVGYGEQKKDLVTGSVVQIDAEEIKDIPVGNLSQALIGRLAGVKIGQSTGKPGASNPITIRTSSSIEIQEIVLYVIDGVIYEDGGEQFNLLDPSEVESISILKGAAAAVYGARASGGVVLVKTKKGKEGRPRISYSTSVGIGEPTQLPEMLSARQHAVMLNEMYDYEHGKYRNDPNYESSKKYDFRYFSPDELEALDTLNYNWLDGLYDNSFTIRHTLNLSGGTDKVRYFVGGSYYDETGNIDNLSYEKYSVRANMDADITNDVTFSLGVSTNRGSSKEPYFRDETSRGTLRDTYKRLLTAPKWTPPTINDQPVFISGSWNPYGLLASNNYKSGTSSNTNITGALEYRIPVIKGLTARVQYSYNEASSRGKQFSQDFYTYDFVKAGANDHLFTDKLKASNARQPYDNEDGLQESTGTSTFYQLNASLSYARDFGKHNIEALLVYEQAEEEENGFWARKMQAVINGYDQFWAFSNLSPEIGSNASETGRLAYIGRLNYHYGGKYLLEAAFRYEASQKFHPDHAWGLFPSLSAGWIISEENFFDNVSFIDFMKLRASAGRLGNDGVGAFIWKAQYGANETGPIFGNSLTNAIAVKREGVVIPTITWQKTDVYNVGLDFRFLNHKLNFSTDAYYRYGFDLLTRRSSYPITTGIAKPPSENFGRMSARGLEVQLGYTDNVGPDFEYSINGNISYDYHRVLEVDQSPAAVGRWDDRLRNDPSNQPGWIALGIIRTQEDLDNVRAMYDSIGSVPVRKGMIYYKDIRGYNYSEGPDGKLDEWDKTIIAEMTSAPYHYGFSLGASWKGLSLNATFSGAFGHKVLTQKDEQALPTETTNVFAWWGDYWTPDNPDAAYPRPYDYGLMEQHSTFWMRDGHTLRLNNVNLSYALPSHLLEKWNLPEFRLYFTGTNMWTVISPFEHKDPAVSRAYDYPLIRSYNFGLNISL